MFGAVCEFIDLELAVVFWCQCDAKSKFRGKSESELAGKLKL